MMFRGGLDAFLTSQHTENLRQWGEATRDMVTALLGNLFQSEAMVENLTLRPTTADELNAELPMPVLMAQIDLLLSSGDLATGLLFIGLDDASLILELAPGLAEMDAGDQSPEDRVLDLLSNVADALNRANPGEDSFAVGGVATIESPDGIADALMSVGGDELAELSYSLSLPNIIEGRVIHVLPLDFLVKLAGLVGGEDGMPSMEPPPAARSEPPSRTIEQRPPRDDGGLGDLGGFDFGGGVGLGDLGSGANLGGLPSGFGGHPEPTVRTAQFGPLPDNGHGDQIPSNLELLMDVSLNVTVELGRTSMTIKDILGLGPGSVVELDKLAGEPVDILVNDRTIAKGEVVVVDENFGVRVTEIISPLKRVASLR